MLSISTNYSATSGEAYLELLQKQMENARKNAEAIDQLSSRTDLDQKALARQRVKEIKEQIEALRRMLMLFGGKDAKAVLQQLKQLGSQLKQAAGVLQASSETGLPDATSMSADTSVPSAENETSDVYSEGRNAYAEQQASADADAAGVVPTVSSDPQRAEDDRQLEAATQALKSLRSSLERMIKNGEDRR
ncbi:hypothetical protein GJ699_27980 [Duganella sp. FT80W]|uniref:Uncharacterized protein n=1 Tax=Duganella guangzhouensis TaxID=2666084 RepID=A0A6I2L6R1_9BURK|nr:hypothetical protein [Duganella guangzhouensis]MRW93838.1 hypothetical protein [Duganella guangzhouensis]